MSAKPGPEHSGSGKTQRTRSREASPQAPAEKSLNLGCGTLVVLFLLVATAGKFLPHGNRAVTAKVGTPVAQPRDRASATARPPFAATGPAVAQRMAPPPPKPKTTEAPHGWFEGARRRLGQWSDAVTGAFTAVAGKAPARPPAPAARAESRSATAHTLEPPAKPVTGPPAAPRKITAATAQAGSARRSAEPADSGAPTGRSGPSVRQAEAAQGKTVVFNSPWNQSVAQVERYLKRHAHNADSIDILEWGKVVVLDRSYQVRCTYRSKNVLGKFATQSKLFVLDQRGEVVDIRD